MGGVRHPTSDELPCSVIQYADDTLIALRAEKQDVLKLRQLLDQFADATGLKINFHKSTVVPMHVPEQAMSCFLDALGCRRDQFPQTYLGMLLSNIKLNLSAFAPLINRQIPNWRASYTSQQHGARCPCQCSS